MLLNFLLLDVVIMALCWLIVTYNQRAGLVDVAWSFCIALNVMIAAFWLDTAPLSVRIFIGCASSIWFLRLTWHLLRRYWHESEEDRRYANMRRAMGQFKHLGFLAFFMFQAGLAILFSYPMLSLLSTTVIQWSEWTHWALIAAAIMMLLAFIGESTADQQLYRFKQKPEHHGKTMDQGLWKYSRHPNYFFEWLHWFAYPILGLAAGQYLLWVYPLLMWAFLYYITGIPFSEQQALRHRGQNYRDYQQRTSMFIPWQPKE
jgi:steroid 5-alpha reductase family enzyme